MLKGIRQQKGFTLLELLIVIVIIGILIALVLPNLINGPVRARDVRRKEDLNGISSGLEQYYNDNSLYPATLAQLTGTTPPYLKEIPKDPKTNADYTYTPLPAGGPYTSFTLQATLENKNDKAINVQPDTYQVVNKQ